MAELPTRRLGRTDIESPVLGLGGAPLGGLQPVTSDEAVATVRRAYELGLRFIDTAPAYRDSETRIGRALSDRARPGLMISTKLEPHPSRPDSYASELVRQSVENSLRLLGRSSVEILLIHDPLDMDPVFRDGDGFDALDRIRDEGKCRYIGLGVRRHEFHRAAIEAGRVDVILPFGDYNLVRRTALPLIRQAHEAGVGVMLGSPQMGGVLARGDPAVTRKWRDFSRMCTDADFRLGHEWWEWCRERGVELRHLNMQFVLAHPQIDMVLTGAAAVSEIETNVHEALTPMPEDVWRDALLRVAELDAQAEDG